MPSGRFNRNEDSSSILSSEQIFKIWFEISRNNSWNWICAAHRGKRDNEMRFEICLKLEWLCRIRRWNSVFHRWHVFPELSGGQFYISLRPSTFGKLALRKHSGLPLSANFAVEFFTSTAVSNINPLLGAMVWFWRDSAGQATLSRRCIGMKLLTCPAAVHYRLLVAK